MYIANLCLFYQHTVKNAIKRQRLSPDKHDFSNEWKVTKSEIDNFFLISDTQLHFPFLSCCQLTWPFFCVTHSPASTHCAALYMAIFYIPSIKING